jgi:hypothetical protein
MRVVPTVAVIALFVYVTYVYCPAILWGTFSAITFTIIFLGQLGRTGKHRR